MHRFGSAFVVFVLYACACIFLIGFLFLDDLEVTPEKTDLDLNYSSGISTTVDRQADSSKTSFSNRNGIVATPADTLPESDSADNNFEKTVISPMSTSKVDSLPIPFNVYRNSGDTGLLNCQAYARVYFNRARVKIPYYCSDYGLQIKALLEKEQNSTLMITGYTTKDELEGIGLQRATYIQKLLKNVGIPLERMRTNSSYKPIEFVNGTAKGGIRMSIQTTN
ncbi:hypothetical protein [Nonlabens xiamenensis]|uniref:hypothetical protein n=1 Tax=Nonlabens xiamenensis TaxID=2341043 RepID=UPI000F60AFEC|nr:hypothetical protein [Nonlabens xiamenensis]